MARMESPTLSDGAVNYAFEQLEPSASPPPRDAPARLLAQASTEAHTIREHARAEGHAEGRASGHADGLAEVSAAASALEEALRGVEAIRVEAVEAVERTAVELAIELAGKILAGALSARPEMVVDVVQGALRRVSDRRHVVVLVNPADLDMLREAIGQGVADGAQNILSGVELCDLQSDQRVEAGGAIVRTAEGELDAGVQTQLERAREVVEAALADDEPALEIGQQA
jgi:flagellar assembly protein FliH